MAETKFFLSKVRVDPATSGDKLESLNQDNSYFDLEGLLAAMRRAFYDEAQGASADDGMLLQVVRQLAPSERSDRTFGLSYSEVALLLKRYEGSAYSSDTKGCDGLVMAVIDIVQDQRGDPMDENHQQG